MGRRHRGVRLVKMVLGVSAVAMLAAGCDWSVFGYDSGNTRDNTIESTISTINVSTIKTAWSGSIGAAAGASSAVTGNSEVYIGAQNGSVYAFDENGVADCTTSTPGVCTPLWSSAPEGTPVSSPAAVNGVVYVGAGGTLYAYDASGITNCSGTPVVCQPLWSSSSTGNSDMSTPSIVNGVVYVHDSLSLYAFDSEWYHELLGHTQGVSAALERIRRRQQLRPSPGREQQRRLHGRRRQALRLRRERRHELLRHSQDVHPVVVGSDGE